MRYCMNFYINWLRNYAWSNLDTLSIMIYQKIEDLISIGRKVMFLECLDVKVYQALVKKCKCIQACFDFKFCLCFGKHLPKFKQNIPIYW